jgi:tRNA-2-methylthio-N6-dimethylallyladenosine synthase
MNERDSETIAGLLEQMGYKKAAEQDGADVLIINTCSVRENADNRFFGLLGRLKHVKTKRPDAIIAVCGCMMQQEHIVDQIKDKHAFVDVIFGTHNIDAVPDLIEGILRERKTKRAAKDPVVQILTERDGLKEGLPAKREYSFKASVNIMYGCNNFCTYCIVPYTRGREISRDAERIIAEVRGLAEAGTKEILLLGQNVNSYNGFAGATYGDAGDEGLFEKNGEKTRIDFADLITLVD